MLIGLYAAVSVIKKTIENLNGRGDNSTPALASASNIQSEHCRYKVPNLAINLKNKTMSVNESTDKIEKGGGSNDYSVITFKGDQDNNCYAINSKNVKIIGSDGKHNHGSSQVKLKNIVNYKWDIKNQSGHLIAVHLDGNHIAYAIKVTNKNGGMEGMVRVFNVELNLRTLIKGMSGETLDLQFAYIEQEHILASIDAFSLFVHKIDMINDNLRCNLIVKIEDPIQNHTPKYDKISWCPFIDTSSENDDSQLIVWARDSRFQCFNIKTIVAENGVGNISVDNLKEGYLKYRDNAITISWVTLSPDASTLGVGSTDGMIRFFQIYMHDDEPRCLHQWNPHNGKSISSFFFLDDLTNRTSESYWKYALTGAANNTELKIWDCVTWECLQTVQITSHGNQDDKKTPFHFLAEMSRSASYLVLTCFETRVSYVIQIDNSVVNNSLEEEDANTTQSSRESSKSLTHPIVYIRSVAEFPMNSVVLSFSIVDAAIRRYKCGNDDNYLCEAMDDFEEESNSVVCVVVQLFIVQPKSLQECRILYQPSVLENDDIKSTISTIDTVDLNKSDSSTGEKFNASENKYINGIEKEDKKVDQMKNEKEKSTKKLDFNHTQNEEKNTEADSADKNEQMNGNETSNQDKDKEKEKENTKAFFASDSSQSVISPNSTLDIKEEKTDSESPQSAKNARYGQLNLMTPEAFTCPDKAPEGVSSEVLNTILMLAGVPGQKNNAIAAASGKGAMNLVNNKVIEQQEQEKQKQSLESQKKFIAAIDNPNERQDTGLASGASSPSREVREIMSSHEYDKSSFSGDELIDDAPAESADNALKPTQQQEKTTEHWPKTAAPTKHSTELQNAANLISQAVHASSANNLNSVPPTFGNATNNSSASTTAGAPGTVTCSNTELSALNMKMSHLIELVKVQSMQINSLQNEIADIKKCNPMASAKNMSEFSYKLEIQLSKLLEQYLKRMENEHNKKLSAFMTGRDVQNRELRESYIQIMNQYLLTQVGDIVSKVITVEIQRQIAPMLSAKMDSLHKQIHVDVTQKLTSFDKMLHENISQVCKSKNIIETFGKSVLLGVQNSLQAAFIESMSTTLIPAYEKSSQNMFKQLHDAFSDGIKEFMLQLDNYMRNLHPVQAANDDIREKFGSLRQHFDVMLNKQRGLVNDTMLETRKDVKGMEILLARQIENTVRTEMRKCFENQTVALRSQANTPAPAMYDMRESIKSSLQQGHINKAFHTALLANDLALVEYALKHADHHTVFNPNCVLEQKVLLSLIQQISADMSNHNEIKQNYLSEALLAIDPSDPITREHAPKVLQELFRSCQVFLLNQPKSPQCTNVRMLLKGIQGFKDQF